jgi:hypothetical protein
MKAAKELIRLGESDPSIVLNDDNAFDAPEGPFFDEREAMEDIINEDALNSDLDDSGWKDESGEVVGDATCNGWTSYHRSSARHVRKPWLAVRFS